MTLTSDGRVYLHAKNMSLSAGLLQSPIYAQILRALDTPAAVLQGLGSSGRLPPGPAHRSCSSHTWKASRTARSI